MFLKTVFTPFGSVCEFHHILTVSNSASIWHYTNSSYSSIAQYVLCFFPVVTSIHDPAALFIGCAANE